MRVATLAVVVLAFVLVTTGIFAIVFPSRAAASSSSLTILDGAVAVSHDGATFAAGHDGDFVQQGDVVRTGSDAHAVLTFFDGSIIEVEPNTELIVQTLQANSAGDILMTMVQTVGRSWHVVSRALTVNSKYEVRTPSATATVRGTAFQVSVSANGGTNLQTTEGKVHALAGNAEVEVAPGFQTNVQPGGAPPDPVTPTPEPASAVRVVVNATPNVAVTDSNGRTVGVLNGLPIRYVPGSTVQNIDGKLVITIPNVRTGKLDTHVQPAKAGETSVDVNMQVIVGGATVGNVTEHRNVDASGIARGGMVMTSNGTFVLPDGAARNALDPRIGKIPAPPVRGLELPFGPSGVPGPTAIVIADPSFVPRFGFDPRLTVTTALPAVPSPLTVTTFDGGFQPFVAATAGSVTGAPAANTNLIVFTAANVPTELAKLALTTPIPVGTLDPRLTVPMILNSSGPTITGTQILPGLVLPSGAGSAAPSFVILQSFNPGTSPGTGLPSFAPTGTSLPSFTIPPLPSFTAPASFSLPPSFTLPPLPSFSAPASFSPPPSTLPPSFSTPPLPSFTAPPSPFGSPSSAPSTFPSPSGLRSGNPSAFPSPSGAPPSYPVPLGTPPTGGPTPPPAATPPTVLTPPPGGPPTGGHP